MKIITGSSKVVQGTGETQSATVSYEFGVKGSEQKRVRDRSIVQGTAPEVDPAGFVHFRRKHMKEPALIVANYGTPPGAVARWLLVQTIIPVVRHRFRGKKVQLAA